MSKKRDFPKVARKPSGDEVRIKNNPDYYLKENPVWSFGDFDWDGPWGLCTCTSHIQHIKTHISSHLASFETMTWAEILKASGGRSTGNNSHHIARDKFVKEAIDRLNEKKINDDMLFSLRLDAGTRIYGVRNGACLRIVFFDPHHKDKSKSAYDFS